MIAFRALKDGRYLFIEVFVIAEIEHLFKVLGQLHLINRLAVFVEYFTRKLKGKYNFGHSKNTEHLGIRDQMKIGIENCAIGLVELFRVLDSKIEQFQLRFNKVKRFLKK